MEHRKYIVTPLGCNCFVNNYIDSCRNCEGTGLIHLLAEGEAQTVVMCDVCQGSGEVAITKHIQIIVKPFKRQ